MACGPAAVLLGAGVAALWILPESPLADAWPWLRDAYGRWAVRPLGALPEVAALSPYAPEQCGWTLAVVRLLGSAFIIGVAETRSLAVEGKNIGTAWLLKKIT